MFLFHFTSYFKSFTGSRQHEVCPGPRLDIVGFGAGAILTHLSHSLTFKVPSPWIAGFVLVTLAVPCIVRPDCHRNNVTAVGNGVQHQERKLKETPTVVLSWSICSVT